MALLGSEKKEKEDVSHLVKKEKPVAMSGDTNSRCTGGCTTVLYLGLNRVEYIMRRELY